MTDDAAHHEHIVAASAEESGQPLASGRPLVEGRRGEQVGLFREIVATGAVRFLYPRQPPLDLVQRDLACRDAGHELGGLR